MFPFRTYCRQLVCALFFALLFCFSVQQLKPVMRPSAGAEIQVILPLGVQILLAGGDRYLAANMEAIRALVTVTDKMQADEFPLLAKVHTSVSWLNPAHEDNYYVAAAILPWSDQFDAGQTVLRRAADARPFDMQPAFFYAFDLFQIKRDVAAASASLRRDAKNFPEGSDENLYLQGLAARWMDRAGDPELAIKVLEMMANGTKRKDFKRYLEMRIGRLHLLQQVQAAVIAYRDKFGKLPGSAKDMVSSGFLPELPQDPLGAGFMVTPDGVVDFRH